MTIAAETYTLANGVAIPKIGFGTWQMPDGEETYQAVLFALQNGYKHVDTARAYGNEPSVGRAVRDSGIARDQIFVTTKLPAEVKDYDAALASFETTMGALGLDYVDLYLIHAPWPWDQKGADFRKENGDVWRALEEIYRGGRCRAIGVSNFSVDDLTTLAQTSTVTPMANQIRFFIGNTQEDVTRYCQEHNILVEAYSPLATGALLQNEDVATIARKYGTSVSQLSIRYTLQRGTLPLPKSTHTERILQNADVDFTIEEEDMRHLDGLRDTARR
jgi:diketogulonate reductase-like aldo/keto reductase